MLFGHLCCPGLGYDGVAELIQAVLFAPNTIQLKAVLALYFEMKTRWMILCEGMV